MKVTQCDSCPSCSAFGASAQMMQMMHTVECFLISLCITSGVPCLQSATHTPANTHIKVQEGDVSKSLEGEPLKQRPSHTSLSDPQSNIFVLIKMVEEVFTVLYSKKRP